MNIFFLSYDPRECAWFHNDKHVSKMILETAQILCTAKIINGQSAQYKATHKNHPCVIWASKSQGNFEYLINLGIELNGEFAYRFGKYHKSYVDVISKIDSIGIPRGPFTPPPLAMPKLYKVEEQCPVVCYRSYYIYGKDHLAKWTRRGQPHWYDKGDPAYQLFDVYMMPRCSHKDCYNA